MGVFTYETQIVTKIPPAKIFKAFVLDGDQILPNVVPQAIKRVEIIEGDGGHGTIKKITFGEDSRFSYVKHKVEALDKDNLMYRYGIIEGAALMDKLEKITYETKIEPSLEGGSICKNTGKSYTISDFEIKEGQLRLAKKRPLDCSMLLKLTSWQTLMPSENFDHKTTIPFIDHMKV